MNSKVRLYVMLIMPSVQSLKYMSFLYSVGYNYNNSIEHKLCPIQFHFIHRPYYITMIKATITVTFHFSHLSWKSTSKK